MVLLLAAGKVAGAAGVFWWWVAWGCLAACWWWVAGLPVWLPVLTAGWLSVGLKGLAACWAACTLGLWGSCLDAGLAMHCCFPRCCGSPHLCCGGSPHCCGGPFLWDRFRASPGACKVPSKRARRHADAASVHAFLKPPWCRPAHAIPDAPLQELPNALMDSDLPFPTPPSANPAL